MRSFLLACLATLALLSTASADDIEYKITGPFDASQLPFVSEDDRKSIEGTATDPHNESTYVLAISESGKYAYWSRQGSTQDRIRRTMQICEHVSGSQCGLAVVNGKMVKFNLLSRQLTYPDKFDIEAVPFTWKRDVNYLREYSGARRHKAFALNYNGFFNFWHGVNSAHTAKQNALAWCRRDSGWDNCFLYDVNGTVVFNPDTDIFGGQ